MKLKEIFEKIESGDFSPEINAELHKSLRRSGDDFIRSQHCRVLAQRVFGSGHPGSNEYALLLLNDAELMYTASSVTELTSVWQLRGNMLFEQGDYEGAYNNFSKWAKAEEAKQTGLKGAQYDLLRAVLLRDSFGMSDEIKQVFALSKQDSSFVMRDMKIYRLVGEMVIAAHEGDEALQESLRSEAQQIIDSKNHPSGLEKAYAKNRIKDAVSVPDKVLEYIKAPRE